MAKSNPAYDLWHDPEIGEALEDHLTVLHREGLSFGAMAERLGVSRSAAIGKAHRLGLAQPKEKITLHDVNKALKRKRQRTPPTLPAQPPKPPAPNPHLHYCPVWQLTNESCRYPMWRDDTPVIERLYCGVPEADINGKRPFCRKHAKLCYTPDRRR